MSILILILLAANEIEKAKSTAENNSSKYLISPPFGSNVGSEIPTRLPLNSTVNKKKIPSQIFDENELAENYKSHDYRKRLGIIGGVAIPTETVSSQVVLLIKNVKTCIGNLVTVKSVLTAAHCVTNVFYTPANAPYFRVISVDDITLLIGSAFHYRDGEQLDAREIHVHPDFMNDEYVTMMRDIAVVNLLEEVMVSERANSATIHSLVSESIFEEMIKEKCTVAGWGASSTRLRTIEVTVMRPSRCKSLLNRSFDAESQFCSAGDGQKIADTDFGAGLFFRDSIVAVASWSFDCNRTGCPVAVFSRVDNAYNFIGKVINGTVQKNILLYVFIICSNFIYLFGYR